MAKPYYLIHITTKKEVENVLSETKRPNRVEKYTNIAELRSFAYPGAFSSSIYDSIVVGNVSEKEFNKNYVENLEIIKAIFKKRHPFLRDEDFNGYEGRCVAGV